MSKFQELKDALQQFDAAAFETALNEKGQIKPVELDFLAVRALASAQTEPLKSLARHGVDLDAPISRNLFVQHSGIPSRMLPWLAMYWDNELHLPKELRSKKAGQPVRLKALLAAGANPSAVGEEAPPLYDAVRKRDLKAVKCLLKAGAEVNALYLDPYRDTQKEILGTALWLACNKARTKKDLALIKALLNADADPNIPYGDMPLLAGCIREEGETVYQEIVDLLLTYGADPNIFYGDPYRRTPLHGAAMYEKIPVITRLIAAGADPNLEDNCRWTALDYWVEEGPTRSLEVPKALVRGGADLFRPGKIAVFDKLTSAFRSHLFLDDDISDSISEDGPPLSRQLKEWQGDVRRSLQDCIAAGALGSLVQDGKPTEAAYEYAGWGLLPEVIAALARQANGGALWGALRDAMPAYWRGRMDSMDTVALRPEPSFDSHAGLLAKKRETLTGKETRR